jgi:hypothetical protein
MPCECGVELAGDSPDLRLQLTCDDAPIAHCVGLWEREFGETGSERSTASTMWGSAISPRLNYGTGGHRTCVRFDRRRSCRRAFAL